MTVGIDTSWCSLWVSPARRKTPSSSGAPNRQAPEVIPSTPTTPGSFVPRSAIKVRCGCWPQGVGNPRRTRSKHAAPPSEADVVRVATTLHPRSRSTTWTNDSAQSASDSPGLARPRCPTRHRTAATERPPQNCRSRSSPAPRPRHPCRRPMAAAASRRQRPGCLRRRSPSTGALMSRAFEGKLQC